MNVQFFQYLLKRFFFLYGIVFVPFSKNQLVINA